MRPRSPRCVFSARSFRNRAFIVPLNPMCRCVMSPSASVTMFTPANVRRLKRPAVSSWSRLKRSSDSGEDHVESTVQRIAHQRLEAGTKQRGARHRVVGVLLRDRPALSLGKRAADAHLIGDGRVTLVVRRVARVDGDFHAGVPQ